MYIVVAGGGGGGNNIRWQAAVVQEGIILTNYVHQLTFKFSLTISVQTYPITVGAGGNSRSNSANFGNK